MKNFSGIKGFEEFCDFIQMDSLEKEARREMLKNSNMCFQVNEYYASLIKQQNGVNKQQLLNIVLPPIGPKPFTGRFDPYGNTKYRQEDKIYLQHKYKQTLLVHINNSCFCRCQFCYKVNEVNNDTSFSYQQIVADAVDYIKRHPSINNVLLTGGDPMTLSDAALEHILIEFGKIPQIKGVRIATKAISFYPQRFENERLLAFFKHYSKNISIIAQISHPAEFSEIMICAVNKIQKAGASVRLQPVLARGINDDVKTLVQLFQRAYENNIIPYYLVLFMPVRGVEQYALPMEEAYKIVAKVSDELSGLEKKSLFITANDYGKFEICGFLPSVNQPQEIILKWHQIAQSKYLPEVLLNQMVAAPFSLMKLKFESGCIYNIDDVFHFNNINTSEGDI